MSAKIPPGGPPPTLLHAAERLAKQGQLDAEERSLVESMQGDAGKAGAASTEQLADLLNRHQDALSTDQRQALRTLLGDTGRALPGKLLDLTAYRAEDSAPNQVLGGLLGKRSEGPEPTLSERKVLEDLLQRHGDHLDGQLANLVKGFLRTLPDRDTAPPRGQLGALAQIVALRGDHKPFARRLDLDPEQDGVPRAKLEQMLDANASRGQLLVALGAASDAELAQLNAGEMSLGEFYRLAARGHFGEQLDQPVSYQALREKMSAAGLEIDFHRLLGDLDPADSERLLDGQLTPREIFTLLAQTRGEPS